MRMYEVSFFLNESMAHQALLKCQIKPIPALVHGVMQLNCQRQQSHFLVSLLQADSVPMVFSALKALEKLILEQPQLYHYDILLAVLELPKRHPACSETAYKLYQCLAALDLQINLKNL
jgi:hypothetical protein